MVFFTGDINLIKFYFFRGMGRSAWSCLKSKHDFDHQISRHDSTKLGHWHNTPLHLSTVVLQSGKGTFINDVTYLCVTLFINGPRVILYLAIWGQEFVRAPLGVIHRWGHASKGKGLFDFVTVWMKMYAKLPFVVVYFDQRTGAPLAVRWLK